MCRHEAIFGSGSSISRKLSQQAPWHLDLASGPCHCGQIQADLTDFWDPRTAWKVGSLDLRGQLTSEFFLTAPLYLRGFQEYLPQIREAPWTGVAVREGPEAVPPPAALLGSQSISRAPKFGLGWNESKSVPWSYI